MIKKVWQHNVTCNGCFDVGLLSEELLKISYHAVFFIARSAIMSEFSTSMFIFSTPPKKTAANRL